MPGRLRTSRLQWRSTGPRAGVGYPDAVRLGNGVTDPQGFSPAEVRDYSKGLSKVAGGDHRVRLVGNVAVNKGLYNFRNTADEA